MEVLEVNDDTYLRGLREQDAPALFELIETDRERLSQWLAWLPKNRTEKDTLNFILASHRRRQAGTGFTLAIWHQKEICGVIGFNNIDAMNGWAEIGYWISAHAEGKGIVTEGCRVLTSFAFVERGLHRVQIRCATGNVRSQKIPEHLGFEYEGTLRDVAKIADRFLSLRVYSMLSSQW